MAIEANRGWIARLMYYVAHIIPFGADNAKIMSLTPAAEDWIVSWSMAGDARAANPDKMFIVVDKIIAGLRGTDE